MEGGTYDDGDVWQDPDAQNSCLPPLSVSTTPLRDPSQCLLSRATNLNFSSFTNPYDQPFTSMTMTTVMTTE